MTPHPRRGREEGKPNPGSKPHAGSRMPPWAPAPPSGRAPHLVPFTPLRAPPSDILAYAEECHLVRTPDPRPDPSGADMSKYCKYHRCHGHNTNDCQARRKEIERLIQAGKLGTFIDWDRMAKRDTRGRGATPQMPQTGKEKDRDEPNRPVINVIFGGEALGKQAYVGAERVSCVEATHMVHGSAWRSMRWVNHKVGRVSCVEANHMRAGDRPAVHALANKAHRLHSSGQPTRNGSEWAKKLEILENNPYGAAEPAADPEKPDPDVKWRLADGSTLPTAPEPPTGSDGKATDDVPPALFGLIRNPSAGVVVEVGMAGARGRRRGRYSGNFHSAMLKEAWHTRASIIVSRAGEILCPLPILYGIRLGALQGAGVGDLLFLVFALKSRVGKLQFSKRLFRGSIILGSLLQTLLKPDGLHRGLKKKKGVRTRNALGKGYLRVTSTRGTHIHQIPHQMRTQGVHRTAVHPKPSLGRGSWGSYSIDGDLGGPKGRSTLAGLSRAITGGAAREGEKRTPDSTPSKVGSAITPTEDSSSSDCVCEGVGLPRVLGELTRRDVVTREKRQRQRVGWKLSRGTIICTPSPSHSSREFNSGCVSFDRTQRGTVGSRLRPWVENGSEVWEEDGGLVVRERVSIIVGMVCIGVKGERVIPKVPKPVLGGEITMGSLGVRERGVMSCGGAARRDRGEAAGGGAARVGEESFGCIAIWPCDCGQTTRAADRGGRSGARGVRTGVTAVRSRTDDGLRIAVVVRCARGVDWRDGRAAERTDDGLRIAVAVRRARGADWRDRAAERRGLLRTGVTVRRWRAIAARSGRLRREATQFRWLSLLSIRWSEAIFSAVERGVYSGSGMADDGGFQLRLERVARVVD
nr:uncharacterized protein LOC109171091 [Ipomoea trifida]